jgi:hypothetical protein
MALPASGQISLSQVNTELGNTATALITMGSAAVRGLFGVASGQIAMSNGYGKSNQFSFSITTTQTDANLRTLAVSAGWDQSSAVQATINSGVSINGSVAANSTAALTIDGSWPGGVTLINNGSIVGRGGNGSTSGPGINPQVAGTAGGRALLVSVAVTLQNNGTIAGGGGGGGAGANAIGSAECEMGEASSNSNAGGGGGGGGQSSIGFNSSGGAGITSSASGCGIIINGSNGGTGTSSSAGGGGAGGSVINCTCPNANIGVGNAGGSGGSRGSAGGGGGNAGANGGAAGQAISGNSNITWVAFGTRLGPIV